MNVNSGRLHIILIMQFAIVSLQVSESKLKSLINDKDGRRDWLQ
ncbi:hypothetical protein T07_558 [Trichinella nelsoni]|uniref:Uncharacterized protein n=1 Tax=Trichinella nelsoni TaxID=6336 RepID=A0A0V0RAD3_9BILA|nr:hypothetical protein T07_558 [Trichinella nelsoni]